MKTVNTLAMLTLSTLFSYAAVAQEMPQGAVVVTLNCSLNDGVSMEDAVRWGRSLPRNENAPNQVYFRQAINVGNNFRANYDFQIARYYGSYSNYMTRMEANRGGNPGMRSQPPASAIMSCNPGSNVVVVSRIVPDNDGFTAEDTLMMTRFCPLENGSTYADAWTYISGIADNFRAAGNNTMMQMITRQIAPVNNTPTNRAVVIAEVAMSAEKMGERMDLARGDMNPTAGLESPFSSCNFPALWRSHAIHRANPPQ